MPEAPGPKVSVVMPAYNAAAYIEEAIQSVLRQTFRDFEIVVIDDGSTDGTAEVVAATGAPVRLLRQANGGAASARNRGIEAARGEFVAFLDADDLWHPRMLRAQLEAFARQPEAGLVFTNCWYTDGRRILPLTRTAQRRAAEGWVFRALLAENFVMTTTVMVRRECLERVGMFDESLPVSEDYDLWMRIARHYRFAFVSEALGRYRLHAGGTFLNLEKRYAARRRILEKLIAGIGDDPAYAAALEQFRFSTEYRIATWMFGREDFDAARAAFLRAAAIRRYHLRLWGYLLETRLPAGLLRGLRRARHRFAPRAICHDVLVA
jgi:glycosyltransferase involved in cell wall biosynthesis